ncbi:malto-oligosyltrehalose trehalohydrolase [Corynebacterium pseudopelargi]|uniref:Malto-oligosyltrehalose trehalohydrolase n=1 Tax=Corynebacterium pseudopelargi TaxID=2080757 RepID=A0A3G6ITK6_9CORY|nr:malto-oligosyltrehalose trehalohydrolase [Corynebacterium pseudopelargi]AZA08947.1 Malto-oligosyltrehalose trehalohydrolase [Corynebacterium pseudopelargi]
MTLPASTRPDQPTTVWAPFAADVLLCCEGTEIPMATYPNGWFACDVHLEPSQRYGFRLRSPGAEDFGPVLPDPRSQRQPDGVHGLSQKIAPVVWDDEHWHGRPLADEVIYELHVGTFSPEGTFFGVQKRLDYFLDLGVTAIELMPVQPFGGARNWGYDGVDWFAVHEAYGGPDGLRSLVQACHERGISVILDVVFNHFGPDGNYLPAFGPYLSTATTGWGEAVNFSGPHSDEVRLYCLDAARQWLEDFHIDGLRLDAVHAYDDRGAFSIMEQLQAVASEVEAATGKHKYLIAESDLNDPRLIAPSGYGLAGQWVDDIHHCIHTLVSGEDQAYYSDYAKAGIEGLKHTLEGMYFFQGSFSTFRARTHGRKLTADIRPQAGVTYTTTHDQTGNRALGDRPSQNLTPQQLRLKAALVLLSPYVPMLFMGEEFAATSPFPFFCSHESPELNQATSQGRLEEFAQHGWKSDAVPDPADPATFASAKLDWNFDQDQQAMLATYRQLIALRKKHQLGQVNFGEFEVSTAGQVLTLSYEHLRLHANCSNDYDHRHELGPWEYRIEED